LAVFNLNFAGSEFWVGFLPLDHFTFDSDHKFRARVFRFGVGFWMSFLIENHLHNSRAIANVEKQQIAEIAPTRDPPHDDHIVAGIFGAQIAAVVCSLQIAQKIQQEFFLLKNT
jgi:hypothetical protein